MMIAACTVIRDEIDVLPTFLKGLEDAGVAALFVIDNGSTDGSREYLRYSFNSFVFDDPSDAYPQAEWMTELAQRAYRWGADWVLNIDADERWENVDELQTVDSSFNEVAIPMYNALPRFEDRDAWDPLKCPVGNDVQGFKVAHRAANGVKVSMGNHTTSAEPTFRASRMKVVHYAVRGYDRFRKKVERAIQVLPNVAEHQCLHWRDWERSYRNGTLLDTYRSLTQ